MGAALRRVSSRWAAVLAAAVCLLAAVQAAEAGSLSRNLEIRELARVGPWPVVSRLIAYRGRVWFANSVKGVNHNSAEIWSVDAETGELRHERHLFSQDVGKPVVHNGLLYWPHEDSRASLGWGAVTVTNGEDWRDLQVPSATIFHVHGIGSRRGGLLAATSAWRAGFQASDDGGLTWRQVYDHETPEGRVSRMPVLEFHGERVYGWLRDWGYDRLVYWEEGGEPRDVPDWHQGPRIWGLTTHYDVAYWIGRDTNIGDAVWRARNLAARRMHTPRVDWRPVDLVSTGDWLWAAVREKGGGRLWWSRSGETWVPGRLFAGGRPMSTMAHEGAVFIGGTAGENEGVLWGSLGRLGEVPEAPPQLPERPTMPVDVARIAELEASIGAALAVPENYSNHGRDVLRAPVFELAKMGTPGGVALARLLSSDMPGADIGMIGGQMMVPMSDLGRWIVLWGMGVAGAGHVPQELLEHPWNVPPHRSEKYFDPLPIALWTISQTGQNDDSTLAALMARLEHGDDPLWLKGDIAGALSAVTGKRFAYDVDAWRAWWKER